MKHINPDGNVMPCSAQSPQACPFDSELHGDNPTELRAAFEKKMANQPEPVTKKALDPLSDPQLKERYDGFKTLVSSGYANGTVIEFDDVEWNEDYDSSSYDYSEYDSKNPDGSKLTLSFRQDGDWGKATIAYVDPSGNKTVLSEHDKPASTMTEHELSLFYAKAAVILDDNPHMVRD